jgi:FAD/FMN-containing dehydrogenase
MTLEAGLSPDLKERLTEVVGSDGLSDAPERLGEFEADLSGWGRGEPLCVVRPRSARQVQSVVDLANLMGINLVPVSSGPPHHRGDTVPRGDAVIMDLSAMDEVVRVDRRNKVALVEPGVTFGRLQEEVREVGLKVLMPLLPRSNKSVIGSYLEREPILIPKYHWDMTDPLLCTEVVFGSGDLFRTGSAAGPGNLRQQWAAGLAQKNPMGPAQTDFARILQGSQGSMGVVTWATVKLEVLPRIHRFFFVPERRLDKLVELTYRAMRPRLGDEFFILNGVSLAAAVGSSRQEAEGLADRNASFILVYAVAGYEAAAEKRADFQQHDLRLHAQACGVEARPEVPGLNGARARELFCGPCRGTYWKERLAGGWQDLFFLTTLDRCCSFVRLVEEKAKERSFPPERLGIYVQPIQQGRSCHLEFTFFYDPGDGEEASRVAALMDEAARACSEAGAFFSRPYGPWAELAYARCPDSVAALRKVKKILDPAGVMNRGRLCFGDTEEERS